MPAIQPGYDLFSVVKGSTMINLEPLFPGAGIVYSNGVPIDHTQSGNFSTGLQRKGELNERESGVIPIAMFAEHSVSTKPVNLLPFGLGEGLADFHTIINLGGVLPNLPNTDGLVQPSEGVMGIWRTFSGGGRFELLLNINPLIVLTKVGSIVSSLESSDIIKIIDGSGLLNPVGSIGGQWSDRPANARAISHGAFSQGNFFAAIDRASNNPVSVQLTSGGVDAQRLVQCAVHFG